MADDKPKQFISFQQGFNLGDNYQVQAGGVVQKGGAGNGFDRMMRFQEMKKQADAEGLTLAQYLAKLKAEMEEAERAMRETTSQDNEVEVELSDEDKRKALEASNQVFSRVYQGKKVDMLAIYRLIHDHFFYKVKHQYEWMAVYIYFHEYLKKEAYMDFCKQMMHPDWFGSVKDNPRRACKHEALGTYSCLLYERNRKKWSITMKGAPKEVTDKGIYNITVRLEELEEFPLSALELRV